MFTTIESCKIRFYQKPVFVESHIMIWYPYKIKIYYNFILIIIAGGGLYVLKQINPLWMDTTVLSGKVQDINHKFYKFIQS